MRLIKKLFLLGKGLFITAGEEIVKTQDIRILKQQMRDLEVKQNNITNNLVKAKAKACDSWQRKELQELQDRQTEYENHIKTCLVKGKEELAREIAWHIAQMQSEIAVRKKTVGSFACSLKQLDLRRKQMLSEFNSLKQEIVLIELNKEVNSVTACLQTTNSNIPTIGVGDLKASIQEIKKSNELESIRLAEEQKLLEEESNNLLHYKLMEEGVIHDKQLSVDDILNSIKSKMEEEQPATAA